MQADPDHQDPNEMQCEGSRAEQTPAWSPLPGPEATMRRNGALQPQCSSDRPCSSAGAVDDGPSWSSHGIHLSAREANDRSADAIEIVENRKNQKGASVCCLYLFSSALTSRTGSHRNTDRNAVSSARSVAEREPPERASLRGRCLACTASEHSLMWISLAMPTNRFLWGLRRSSMERWKTGCSAST